MSESYKMSNVKISFKFVSEPFVLNSDNLYIKKFANFCVIKSEYSFVIFKAKKGGLEQHCNVTKIRHPNLIPHAMQTFLNFFKKKVKISNIKIENTTSTIKLNKNIDLDRVYRVNRKKMNLRYCSEQFPAVFFHPLTSKGCCLIFRSGKIVLVGFNKECDILKAINICKTICDSKSNYNVST